MKITADMETKEAYIAPEIEVILLDNDITLQLASEDNNPPEEPWGAKANQQLSNDPYKMA